ncbi:MAG: hypothetical protein CME06_10980 [Gemmatimonadetes bacterium]|nr:hypothetical protein [Gemmatimonadota bacterium]
MTPLSMLVRSVLLATTAGLIFAQRHDLDPRARELSYARGDGGRDESHYALGYSLSRTTRRPGARHESRIEASLGCVARSLESTPGSAARYEVLYPDVDLSASEIDIGIDGDTLLEQLSVPLSSDFGYEVSLAADGEIRSIRRTGTRTAFPNARLYQERQNTFVSFLPHLFQRVAGRRKGPGAKWSTDRIEEVQSVGGVVALLKTTSDFELEEIVRGRLARVRVRFRHTFAAANAEGAEVGRLRESGGEGELLFDLERRRPVDYRADERAVYEVAAEGEELLVVERVVSTRVNEREAPRPVVMERSGDEPRRRKPGAAQVDERGRPLPGVV